MKLFFALRRFVVLGLMFTLAGVGVEAMTGTAAGAVTFGAPVQVQDGGRKVVGAVQSPVMGVNGFDTGRDSFSPLDMNGDGGADVVTADRESKLVRVRLGGVNGGTTYVNFDITTAGSPDDLAVADMNGDLKPDVLVCQGGHVSVYLNTRDPAVNGGALSFAAPFDLVAKDANAAVIFLNKIVVVDVDNDHLPEVVGVGTDPRVGNANGPAIQLAVFKNDVGNGVNGFDAAVVYFARGTGDLVVAANLTARAVDGDGVQAIDPYPEIVVGSQNGDVVNANQPTGSGSYTVFLNKGDGTYGSDDDAVAGDRPKNSFLYHHIHAMALADVTGDGFRELLILRSAIGAAAGDRYTFLSMDAGDAAASFFNHNIEGVSLGGNPNALAFEGAIVAADLNHDGMLTVALTDPVNTQGIVVLPTATTGGTYFPTAGRLAIATGAGARAIGVFGLAHDTRLSLAVANDDANNLSLLLNTTTDGGGGGGGGGDEIPAGRGIQFGTVDPSAVEGDTITIPVLRGSASTGQVLVYVQHGGTALESFGGANKLGDYDVIDPATGKFTFHPITFAEGEHRGSLTIKTLKSTASEAADTIVLTIGEPVGDAEVGEPATLTLTILDGKPTLLAKSGALSIKPSNIVKNSAAALNLLGVKVAARTNSPWDFAVSQAFPKGARNPHVLLQYSTVVPASTNDADWTDWLQMLPGKGTAWAIETPNVPVAPKLLFRTISLADGFQPVLSKVVGPFYVGPGPNIVMDPVQNTGLAGTGNYVAYEVGTTLDDVITYRFKYTSVNNTGSFQANHVLIEAPVPKHTTFVSASDPTIPGHVTKLPGGTKPTTKVQWLIDTLQPGGTGYVEMKVQVDPASKFDSKGNPLKAYGKQILESGFTITSDEQPHPVVYRTELSSIIHGSIELGVSRSSNLGAVRGGDVITYNLRAKNVSGVALSGTVRDRVPLGTVLDSVYIPDANGNSTNTKLPNPMATANPDYPAVIYVLLKDFKIPGSTLKKGSEVDLLSLDPALVKLALDGDFVAEEVKWNLASVPAHGEVDLKFSVRVLFDIATAEDVAHPTKIVNDDFDFTTGTGLNQISALYGHKPGVNTDPKLADLTNPIDPSAPPVAPVLQISKQAKGDISLNNPGFHGNGFSRVPGFGDVVTAVQNHGVDFVLTFENSGTETAHGVVIHDVIPEGMVLTGFFKQTTDGSAPTQMFAEQITFYDVNSNVIPALDANTQQPNMTKVRSLDIRLGNVQNITNLPAHSRGTVRYTCQPTITPTTVLKYASTDVQPGPGQIHSFGGFDETQKASGKLQGFFITTTDLVAPAKGSPDDLIVRVLSDISWDFPYQKKFLGDAAPDNILKFEIPITQNGDVAANNAHLDFTVQPGVTLLNGLVGTTDYTPLLVASNLRKPAQFTPLAAGAGTRAKINLGTFAAHSSQTLVVWLKVNSVNGGRDPALAKVGRVWPQDMRMGPTTFQQFTAGRHLVALDVTTQGSGNESPVPVPPPSAPHLSISRNAPYTVKKGGTFTYVIGFANSGDTAATNVQVAMQVPYSTHFISATDGIIRETKATIQFPDGISVPTANPHHYTSTQRTAAQMKVTGPGADIITWNFDTLPAHSSGYIEMKVNITAGFADECVKDHSLYVNADNANSAVLAPNPIGTWVLGKPFDTSKWEILSCFCEHLGIQVNEQTKPALRAYIDALQPSTQIHAMGGLDSLQVKGYNIYALGNGQVLVVGSSLVAAGAGNVIARDGAGVISNDGGSLVATGAGNAISITGISGFENKTCAELLASAPQLVAAGAGNLIAAGAGNLISQDGAGFVLKSNEPGGGFTPISPSLNGLIAAGAGNLISQDGAGFIAAVGASLISQDGAGLISQDGVGLVGNAGGTLSVLSGGGVVSNDGGSLISNDGTTLINAGKEQ